MKTLSLIFGSVLLLFCGTSVIHYQQEIREVSLEKVPQLKQFVQNLNGQPIGFSMNSLNSVEPRKLID